MFLAYFPVVREASGVKEENLGSCPARLYSSLGHPYKENTAIQDDI